MEVNTNNVIQAILTLYGNNYSNDAKNAADNFLREATNNENILSIACQLMLQDDFHIQFIAFDIINLKIRQDWRQLTIDGIAPFRQTVLNILNGIIHKTVKEPQPVILLRQCLAFTLSSMFSLDQFKECFSIAFQWIEEGQKSNDHLELYLGFNLLNTLLEEVNSPYIPDTLLEDYRLFLYTNKNTILSYIYQSLINQIPIDIYEYIYKSLLSFSKFGLTFVDLYHYKPQTSSSSLLSLLLNSLNMPETFVSSPVYISLCTLLSSLTSKVTFPTPEELPTIYLELYKMLGILAIKIRQGIEDEALLLHIIILFCDILEVNIDLLFKDTPDSRSYVDTILYILTLSPQSIASIPLDLILDIQDYSLEERPSFLQCDFNYKLLDLFIPQFQIQDPPYPGEFDTINNTFSLPSTQLTLIQDTDLLNLYQPFYSGITTTTTAVLAGIEEKEYNCFRVGPPGCEGLLENIIYEQRAEVFLYLLNKMKTIQDEDLVESYIYLLFVTANKFKEFQKSISNQDSELLKSFISEFIECLTPLSQYKSIYIYKYTCILFEKLAPFFSILKLDGSVYVPIYVYLLSPPCPVCQVYSLYPLLSISLLSSQTILTTSIHQQLVSILTSPSPIYTPFFLYKLHYIYISTLSTLSPQEQYTYLNTLVTSLYSKIQNYTAFSRDHIDYTLLFNLYYCVPLLYASFIYIQIEEYPPLQELINSIVNNIFTVISYFIQNLPENISTSSFICIFTSSLAPHCPQLFQPYIQTLTQFCVQSFTQYSNLLSLKSLSILGANFAAKYPSEFAHISFLAKAISNDSSIVPMMAVTIFNILIYLLDTPQERTQTLLAQPQINNYFRDYLSNLNTILQDSLEAPSQLYKFKVIFTDVIDIICGRNTMDTLASYV
ncbi:hypothetical protein WA158_000911 [Blastocystis sp. Blastoise]